MFSESLCLKQMNFSLVCAFTSWVFSVTWQDKSAKCPKEAPKVNWAADSGAEKIFCVEEPKKVKVHGIWPNFQRFNVFTGRVIFTDRARDNFDLDVSLYLYRLWWLSAWLLWAISYYSPTRPWGLYQTPRFIYDNDHFDNHTYDHQWQWKWWRYRAAWQWPAPALIRPQHFFLVIIISTCCHHTRRSFTVEHFGPFPNICTFFCQEINSLSTYLLVLTGQDTWDQSRQDGAKTSKKPMGRYRYLCLKEKDWKARRSKSSSYSPKNWQVWERKFKVVRDVAACLEYRWQGQKLLGENCSRKKFTFSDSKLQGNYHKKQKCFRNREMCFLFQLCSIGAVRLASVFTREWHFPHGHVLTRQIDEEFQAFSLITSFSFCNGIKT